METYRSRICDGRSGDEPGRVGLDLTRDEAAEVEAGELEMAVVVYRDEVMRTDNVGPLHDHIAQTLGGEWYRREPTREVATR